MTCGKCQREFALYDINKFIQHKVSRCNKENVQPTSCDDDVTKRRADDTDDDSDDVTATSKRGGGGVKLGHNHVDRPVTIKEVDDELTQKLCGKNLKEIFNNKRVSSESYAMSCARVKVIWRSTLKVKPRRRVLSNRRRRRRKLTTRVRSLKRASTPRRTPSTQVGNVMRVRTYDAMRSHRHVLCK